MVAETAPSGDDRPVVADEAELVRQNEELREAVRARDAFIDIAAHELRNPMSALVMEIDRTLEAARRSGDADLIRRLERAERAVTHYVTRATTLLDVSRINAGKLRLERKLVDFAEVVREVADSYAAEADYFRAVLQVSAPGSLPMASDRLALEQVTGNLISNAIKYGAGAPVAVALTSEGGVARLTVTDQGIGISDTDQARIFERFERLFTGERRGGFGIGLWLVRQLVEALDGEIAVDSAPGQGSKFTVALPQEAAPSEPEKP